jgi:hypothetical protein
LWLTGRNLGASRRALAAASLLAAGLMFSNLDVRAQTLALPIGAVSLWLLQRGGRAKWLVIPLAVLWANIHGSFPLAVAFTGAFAVGSLLTAARRQALEYAVLTLAVAFATCISPYGLEVWRYAIDLSTNDTLRSSMTEWAPTTLDSLTGKTYFIEIAAACAVLLLRRPCLPLTWLLLAGGLSVFGLTAVRNVVWVGIVALPVWAVVLDRAFGVLRDHPTRPRGVALIAAALVGIALFSLSPGSIHLPTQTTGEAATVDQEGALADLTGYLMAEPHGRLFHAAEWGAYLEGHMWPAQQVFIDTRYEVHPTSVWDDYVAVMSGRDDWESILDRYGVERVAIDPDSMPVLAQALDASDAWHQVWRTDHGTGHIVVWQRTQQTVE